MVGIHGGASQTPEFSPVVHIRSPEYVNALVVTLASEETLHCALGLVKICVAFQEYRRFGSDGHDRETVVDTLTDSSTWKHDIQTKARIFSPECPSLLCCRCTNSIREVVRHAFGCLFHVLKACVDLKNMSIFVESSTLEN